MTLDRICVLQLNDSKVKEEKLKLSKLQSVYNNSKQFSQFLG